MKSVLGFALGIITVGVLLIAYGVLSPRVNATAPAWGDNAGYLARPVSDRIDLGTVDRLGYPTAVPAAYETAPVRRVASYTTSPAPRAATVRKPARNWTKTALVIGGSTAAGAGVGGVFGGKKGALVGAAIGGGASSLFEALK
jgi:hypothetical protein